MSNAQECQPQAPDRVQADVAVLLPGSGSRADFVRRAFGPALAEAGIPLRAVQPDPRRLIASSLEALSHATQGGRRVLAGGVSIGAAVGVLWASQNPHSAAGVVAALPAWTGSPDAAPAARSARHTAALLREHGIDSVIREMRASSPDWLADELEASWRDQWPALADALDEAGRFGAVTGDVLRSVSVPVGIAAAPDDPVHPWEAATQWHAQLARAHITPVTLIDAGRDPAMLGHGCLNSLRALGAL
ncbi:alpha/beta fold hydrolase [Hoyosella subflava]|uniref:alpha/beta fold hydrolase n=1 Tax=Hoyosella subflava TaxID=639313 RepID=UPI001ED8E1BF|nr:alpha/beta hydrolase [Hoyosella subflava]